MKNVSIYYSFSGRDLTHERLRWRDQKNLRKKYRRL